MAIFKVETTHWTKEQSLTQQWLDDCLKEMARQNLIFRNEEQFQFCLAWAIQDFFGSYNVLLEESTLDIDYSGKIKKSYTDILVKTDKDEYIAIELKYKTAETSIQGIDLLNHGATDLGRFDYLWDINRLERLVYPLQTKQINENKSIRIANNYRDNKLPIISNYIYDKRIANKKIKGFAVFLTNEEKYWTFSKDKHATKPYKYCEQVMYHDFCIAENDVTYSNNINGTNIDQQDWEKFSKKYKKTIINTWRGRPLAFLGHYKFNWYDYKQYSGITNGTFKYCITEVNQSSGE